MSGVSGVPGGVVIRPAAPADVPLLLAFVRELAEYEREPDAVAATEASLDAVSQPV